MPSKHGDFWGQVLAVMNDAHDECSRMFSAGNADGFEKSWLDSDAGRVAKLSEHPWFAYAQPIPQRIASESIRQVVQGMVEYVQWANRSSKRP